MNAILGFALFFSIVAALFDTYYYAKRKYQQRTAESTGDTRIFGQRIYVRKPRELIVMILVVFIILSIFFSR